MAAATVFSTLSASAADWKPTTAPLMTRWAKEVSPANALAEYPRPQMTRPEWQNLNGLWQFAAAEEGQEPPLGKDLGERILVPYPPESALSGIGRHAPRVWYRRTFTVPEKWSGQRVLLHFDAVDWETTVWVNGTRLGDHKGGYDPFSFDITPHLRAGGDQEVVVGAFDPTDKGLQPRGKQVLEPRGIWYTPTTGIWQTVWLEPVPATRIADLRLTPDLDGKQLRISAKVEGDAAGVTVHALARDGAQTAGTAKGEPGSEFRLPVSSPKPWSPDTPHLYDLRVELVKDGKVVDAVDSYFGMRKASVEKDEKGITRLFLNGKPLFQAGPLDQGFWPDGLHTPPTDEALRWDIEFTKKLGFNMIRKHIKVEPARWYYWADKLGVVVWQDMPSPGTKPLQDPAARQQHEQELKRMQEVRHNSPSIIMWVVWNEGWGQYDTERLTAWVKEMDPSRIVNSASGWHDKGVGDVVDMHRYPGPGSPDPEPTRAAVLGEFGGLGLAIPGHMWQEKTFNYQGTESKEQLTRRYEQLMRRVHSLRVQPGLSAVVYTQTSDVEGENNGLVTYDREVVKMNEERVRLANLGKLHPVEITTVVATAEREPVTWKYTFEKPGENWAAPDFDDSAWKEGPAGFGTPGVLGSTVRTDWTTSHIYLRREFEIPDPKTLGDLYFLVHHDERCEIFLNGVRAGRENGHTTNYVDIAISGEGLAALKPGKNVLAVRCQNSEPGQPNRGGQFIDVGIVSVKDAPE